MPDNPQNSAFRTPEAESGWFALPDHAVLALEGRDAVAFAQAQLMNDVTAVAEGGWQWTGWLTPKGRVIALFALLRPAPDTVWLLVPDADPAELAERLRRFVFRSKLAIATRPDLHVCGRFVAPAAELSGDGGPTGTDGIADARTDSRAQALALPDGGRVLDLGGDGGPRSLRIATEPGADDPAALARWRRYDLRHGWPRLPPSQREQWTPQQLSLERLRAFSVKKGCYPGQEIVARTHFLGQAKRGLGLVETRAPMQPGDALRDSDDGEAAIVGTVVCTEGRLALAVLPLERLTAASAMDSGDADAGVSGGVPERDPATALLAPEEAPWDVRTLSDGLAR